MSDEKTSYQEHMENKQSGLFEEKKPTFKLKKPSQNSFNIIFLVLLLIYGAYVMYSMRDKPVPTKPVEQTSDQGIEDPRETFVRVDCPETDCPSCPPRRACPNTSQSEVTLKLENQTLKADNKAMRGKLTELIERGMANGSLQSENRALKNRIKDLSARLKAKIESPRCSNDEYWERWSQTYFETKAYKDHRWNFYFHRGRGKAPVCAVNDTKTGKYIRVKCTSNPALRGLHREALDILKK